MFPIAEFVSTKFKKNLGEAKNHVRYIAFRARETNEKYGLWDEEKEQVSVEEFCSSLEDKRTSHSSIAKIHTVLFSMSGDEWNRSEFQDGNYKEMIRNIMKDFQLSKGITLSWVAAEHNEKGHPHVHVAIKSVYKDGDGVERRLNISKEDREWFKDAFRQEKNRIRGYELEPPEREFDRSKRMNPEPPSISKGFIDSLIFQINRRLQQEEFEREQEKRSMDR